MKSLRGSQQSGRAPLLIGAAVGALSLLTTGPAAASSGIDSPESGVVQAGRGGAGVRRFGGYVIAAIVAVALLAWIWLSNPPD